MKGRNMPGISGFSSAKPKSKGEKLAAAIGVVFVLGCLAAIAFSVIAK